MTFGIVNTGLPRRKIFSSYAASAMPAKLSTAHLHDQDRTYNWGAPIMFVASSEEHAIAQDKIYLKDNANIDEIAGRIIASADHADAHGFVLELSQIFDTSAEAAILKAKEQLQAEMISRMATVFQGLDKPAQSDVDEALGPLIQSLLVLQKWEDANVITETA